MAWAFGRAMRLGGTLFDAPATPGSPHPGVVQRTWGHREGSASSTVGSGLRYRQKDGTQIIHKKVSATTATPPQRVVHPAPQGPASQPCSTSARRGPPTTTTIHTPWIRPWTCSAADCCRMALRTAELN